MVSRLHGRARRCTSSSTRATKEGDFAYIADKLRQPGDARRRSPTARCWRCKDRRRAPCWSAMRPASSALTFMKVAPHRWLRVRRRSSAAPATPARTVSRSPLQRHDAERVARALLGEAGSAADRSRRAGFAAAGSRALPLRPRHRREHRSGRSRSRLVHRQAPQDGASDFPAAEKIMAGIAERSDAKSASAFVPTARRRRAKAPRSPTRPAASSAAITSGGFGPSVNAPVAMGYVETAFAAEGTEIDLIVRGKPLPARVAPCRSCRTATNATNQ